MSAQLGTYTFLPWLRRGVANSIDTLAGDASVKLRASIDVALSLEGAPRNGGATIVRPVGRPVDLYGPGDVVGVDRDAIQRTDPADWITNFEPNYLAAIEFYDEDLPWRYTPAGPDGRRLYPWLALVVLAEGVEFAEGGSVTGRPLSFIELTANPDDVLPEAGELWAWAHVHFNQALAAEVVDTNASAVGAAAAGAIAANPDLAYSRMLCPRKLAPSTAYHAFLIPAFESGRLAGLGIDPKPVFDDAANALTSTSSAWATYADRANREPARYPYYHRWYFRTGARGDFEYLVRLLQPKVVDSRVGSRDMDVRDPAPNIDGIDKPELGGVLRVGGALRAPLSSLSPEERQEYDKYDQWAQPYPQPFQTQLATFINLADTYQADGLQANTDPALPDEVTSDPDPLVTPPLYGRWHALTDRLLTARDGSDVSNLENWVHELNLDPRWRVAAGLGTATVQEGQEAYMAAAWEQIGAVLEANRRIRGAQLAQQAGTFWYTAQLVPAVAVAAATGITLYAPLHARVVSGGVAVRHALRRSPLSTTLTSTPMRRVVRPGGRTARSLAAADGQPVTAGLLERVNAGEISAAPPKETPPGLPTPDTIADGIREPRDTEPTPSRVLAIAIAIVIALVLLALLTIGVLAAIVVLILGVIAIVLLARRLGRVPRGEDPRADDANSVREENQTPDSVGTMPGAAGFELTDRLDVFADPERILVGRGETDNAESTRFKGGLRDAYTLIQETAPLGRVPVPTAIAFDAITDDLIAATDPAITVPRWVFGGISIPPRIREEIGEEFVEAMAYPEFDTPMYKPLSDADDERFVPNLHLVEPDSITLLETNQAFIEAYMVGLNHEFARELLWREYPTDQRGSYFRQFWDPRAKLAQAPDPTAAREALKDIPPLHLWPAASQLSEHDHREAGRENEEELVLVIRGELLKKYPNTIITAQRARWQPRSETDPTPDKGKERRLDESSPPMTPLYEARVAPDIYFFGFDLTVPQAAGDDTVDDKPGWFFRIEEVPGDARFGFDIERDGDLNVWNDLSWPDVVPGGADGDLVDVSGIPPQTLDPPPVGDEKRPQWESDQHVPLDATVSSAELAYISFQTPVLMAVHASELLPRD